MSRQLYRSHRTFGYEVGRTRADDGTELVILETATHSYTTTPAHLAMLVSPEEAAFEVRVALVSAIGCADFLGIDIPGMRELFEQEIQLYNEASK